MPKVVYLHVGAPKTGTTYLQDRLLRNRDSLSKNGVSYPVSGGGTMFGAAVDLLDQKNNPAREAARGEWDALMGRVRRSNRTVIVSNEILAAAKPAHVSRAMASLEGAEVHLVYSARDLARQIPAEWQEGLKHGRKKSFRKFVESVQAAPRRGSKQWFWRVQGLPDVLGRWAHNLPPEHVHLVTVPQTGAPRDSLWLRYCRALSLDPGFAPEDTELENVSIGPAEAALIRRLNLRLQRSGSIDEETYARLVRGLLVHQTLSQRERMARLTLPPDAHAWADEVADEWIEWVEGAGIDVVGDVEDLRPVKHDGDWADPDRPRPRKMVNAALDAIEVLLAEASADKEPLITQTRKLAQAARRLRNP